MSYRFNTISEMTNALAAAEDAVIDEVFTYREGAFFRPRFRVQTVTGDVWFEWNAFAEADVSFSKRTQARAIGELILQNVSIMRYQQAIGRD